MKSKDRMMRSQTGPQGRKVALIYDAIFPYVKGGGERRFFEIARLLAEDGYDVHLYGMKFWDGPSVIKNVDVTLHGLCKARPLYTKSGRRSISQPIIFGLSCFKLFGEKLDIVDCCGFPYFSLFPVRLITWLKRKPLYATWHEVWGKKYWLAYLGPLGLIGYTIEWIAIHMPNKIIAVSTETGNRLKIIVPNKNIYLVENGVDIKKIISITPQKNCSDIIFAGRLAEYKNIDILLKAVARIKADRGNVSCIIIGEGPEKAKLKKFATSLGIENNVTFKKFFNNHDEVVRYMKSSKVFVLPSVREGFGMVVIEANAAGIPVVTVEAADNSAVKLISKNNGLVTKLHANAIASAIQKILDKPFSSDMCISTARKYDWSDRIKRLKQVFV